MDIMQYIAQNHDHVFYVIAGISFIVELTIMGLSGPLLFFAIASFITGILISFNLISGWEIELFVLGILTAATTLILWRPLKNFQNAGDGMDSSSDMIGREVSVSADVTNQEGTIRYSGVNWPSRLEDNVNVDIIAKGQLCKITAVKGNIMLVKPIS